MMEGAAMTLKDAVEGKEYTVKSINTDDDEGTYTDIAHVYDADGNEVSGSIPPEEQLCCIYQGWKIQYRSSACRCNRNLITE